MKHWELSAKGYEYYASSNSLAEAGVYAAQAMADGCEVYVNQVGREFEVRERPINPPEKPQMKTGK